MRILGKPTEMIPMSEDQKKKFIERGGLINPNITESTSTKNQSKMMYWETDYSMITGNVDGQIYTGYGLFQKLFPEYAHLSEDEARSQWLMMRYDRNHSAREDFAQNMGSRQATREELEIIYTEAKARAILKNPNAKNSEILREMGQKLLGWRDAGDGLVYNIGEWSGVASSGLDADGDVHGLDFHRDESHAHGDWGWQAAGLSSVVVMDNNTK
jgi:hypothetical protein